MATKIADQYAEIAANMRRLGLSKDVVEAQRQASVVSQACRPFKVGDVVRNLTGCGGITIGQEYVVIYVPDDKQIDVVTDSGTRGGIKARWLNRCFELVHSS